MYHFKAKDSEIKNFSLCLEDISADFSANSMKKVGLNGCVHDIFVDYRAFDTSNVINIHKYLKKIIRLLTGLVNGSNHTKYVFLSLFHFWFEFHFLPSNLPLHSHDICFVNVFDSFFSVIMLNTLRFESSVLFGTHTLLDKSLRVLQLPTHISKLTENV